MILATALPMACAHAKPGEADGVRGFAKTAPYSAVRWQVDAPEVQVEGQWYGLAAINDVPAADIVAFCHRTYGDRWKKRFEEDLVAVLSSMKHPPGDTVALALRDLQTQVVAKRDGVKMTTANRKHIMCSSKPEGCKEKHANKPDVS